MGRTTGKRVLSAKPKLILEIDLEGNVEAKAEWDVSNVEEAKMLGCLAYSLSDGELLAAIQRAVVIHGELEGNPASSGVVLDVINLLIQPTKPVESEQTGPFISPTGAMKK